VIEDVDLDLLADYVSGALDGTSDAATVARLVATDPRWTQAHAALVAADALVRADLAVLAGEPEPMPDDVLARLDAALAAEPPLPDPHRPHLSVLPGGRAVSTPSPRRRPWRLVAGIAAALVVVGLGVGSLVPRLESGGNSHVTSGAASDASSNRAAQPGAGGPGSADAGGVTASGADYNPDTLAALGAASLTAQGAGPAKSRTESDSAKTPAREPAEVPDALRRLADPAARTACLNAIIAEYGGSPSLVDYARYRGSPALVVLLDGARGVAGRKWVVVVGPECGSGGSIGAQRYSAQVG
jgi:hypothetical protein